MKSRCHMSFLVLFLSLGVVGARASVIVDVGSAGVYAVLGQAGVTNTGASVIFGDVGGSTGTPAITGFPPGIVVSPAALLTGTASVFADATNAYNTAQGIAGGTNLTGNVLGLGLANNLVAGVYTFNSSASLNGALILDAGGLNTATWIFQIGSSLTTASASSVQVINAASSGAFTGSIIWAVGSAATLGTTTAFQGTILSQAGDVLNTGASISCGRVISLAASVTLDTNMISTGNCVAAPGAGTGGPGDTGGPGGTGGAVVPEPATFALLAAGLLPMLLWSYRKSRTA
jgi:hypothetical protein